MAVFFLFLLLRLVLRWSWIAVGAIIALAPAFVFLIAPHETRLVAAATALIIVTGYAVVAIRFGMLTLAIAISTQAHGLVYPITWHLSAWYAPLGLMEVALLTGVSIWCFRNALGGRKVLKGDFLEH